MQALSSATVIGHCCKSRRPSLTASRSNELLSLRIVASVIIHFSCQLFYKMSFRFGALFSLSTSKRSKPTKQEIFARLELLCRRPVLPPGAPPGTVPEEYTFSDARVEDIQECLRELQDDDAKIRPRTYTILHMMNKRNLLWAFEARDMMDNQLPYSSVDAYQERSRTTTTSHIDF